MGLSYPHRSGIAGLAIALLDFDLEGVRQCLQAFLPRNAVLAEAVVVGSEDYQCRFSVY